MADVSFIDATGVQMDGNPGDVTLSMPVGVLDGDFLVATVWSNQDGSFTNGGWTNLPLGANGRHQCFVRFALGEGATAVFDFAGTTTRAGGMLSAWRPANGVTLEPVLGSIDHLPDATGIIATNPVTTDVASSPTWTGDKKWLVVQHLFGATGGSAIDLTIDAQLTSRETVTDTDDEPLLFVGNASNMYDSTSPFPALSNTLTRTGGANFSMTAMNRVSIQYTGQETISIDPNKNRYTKRRFIGTSLPYDLITIRLGGE